MPSKQKAPHHRGTYHVDSAKVRAAAYANPNTRCWRCDLTLDQVRATRNPRARWTAGHVNPGEIGGRLLPECSPCNYSHGARIGNRSPERRKAHTWRPQPPHTTDLTW